MTNKLVGKTIVVLGLGVLLLTTGCLPKGPHVVIELPARNSPKKTRWQAYKKYRSGFRGQYCKVFSHYSWEDVESTSEVCQRWKEKRPKRFQKRCIRRVRKRHYRYTPMSTRSACKEDVVNFRDVPSANQGKTLRLQSGDEVVHLRDLLPAVHSTSTTAEYVRDFGVQHVRGVRSLIATAVFLSVFAVSIPMAAVLQLPPGSPMNGVMAGVSGVSLMGGVISAMLSVLYFMWRDEARSMVFANYDKDLRTKLGLNLRKKKVTPLVKKPPQPVKTLKPEPLKKGELPPHLAPADRKTPNPQGPPAKRTP